MESIVSIIGLLAGGGGLGMIFTWRYARRKAKAEAESAEADAKKARAEAESAAAEAAKQVQDMYQEMLTDTKADREAQRQNIEELKDYINEQKAFISELKTDRKHLREEREELRKRQDSLEMQVLDLKRDVARNNRMIEFFRPLLCGRDGCAIRVPVTMPGKEVSDNPAEITKRCSPQKNDIEPVESEAL